MPNIPSNINGVTVEFSPHVNKDVDLNIINALRVIIKPTIVSGHNLNKIYISSANDQHKLPSRHVQGKGKAVDISRINGYKMSLFYPSNPLVKSIVDAIQINFENTPFRRENFGPHLKKKLGNNHPINGHGDHIHLSVN
ncbi:MAG: hypothetical protein GQ546_09240 [Gammaproteobacteria bacterium]|nr:hypothetical protein [Gammaproteobacteria bacterium]